MIIGAIFAMASGWGDAHLVVHELLCGCGSYRSSLNRIEDMTRQYICNSESTNTIYEHFRSRRILFKELDLNVQLFLLQAINLLTTQSVLDELYFLVTRGTIQKTAISWARVFALVAGIVVSVRGGIALLKGFIRKLLIFVFQSTSVGDTDSSSVNEFEMLPDKASWKPDIKQDHSPQFSDCDLFCFALCLARQLSAEDVRLTGFTYSQWWTETFCSGAVNVPTSVLRSRSDVAVLTGWLIELLPWESDPRLLQIQLTNKPNWIVRSSGPKKGTGNAAVVIESLEDTTLVDTDVAMAELELIDAQFRDCHLRRWNDYMEIARGRLAELRDQNQEMLEKHLSNVSCNSALIVANFSPTHGWDEVCAWIDEVSKQMLIESLSTANNQLTTSGFSSIRVPQGFIEANLFQPRKLRTILIPALLGAPENAQLSEMQKVARDRLLVAIRQAGLGSLLEPANETPIHVISKRIKTHQMKPTSKRKKILTQKRLHTSNGHIVTRSRSTRSPRAR